MTGCEAVVAVFTFEVQVCTKPVTGVVSCDECPYPGGRHEHAVCPDHGGPAQKAP